MKKFFDTSERVVLYVGNNFFSIPVIKVVKKMIKPKTRENGTIHGNHLKRAKNIQRKIKWNCNKRPKKQI